MSSESTGKFTMRDLGIAVMEAHNRRDYLVRSANEQLADDMKRLYARAVASDLIKEGEPLPAAYELSG